MTALSRAQATAAAVVIRDETATGANTATRVGGFLANLIDSTVFQGEAETPPTAGNGLTGTNVFSVLPDGATLAVSASGVKVSDLVANSVLGRAVGSSGAPAAIQAITDGHAFRLSGATLGFGTIATAGIADAAVTMAKLANLAGLSLVGRSAAGSGVPAAITATTAGQVPVYDGSTLGFGSPDFKALDLTTTGTVFLGTAATRPSAGLVRIGGSWAITARNSSAVDVNAVTWDSSTNILLFGGGTGVIKSRIQGSSIIELNIGGTTRMVLGSSAFLAYLSELGWDNSVTLPVLDQQDTVGATGQLMTIRAQGAVTTGGALNMASGTGATAGEVSLSAGATKKFRGNATGVGLYTTTPVAQASRVGQLTDSTTGTPSGTIGDVGAVFSQAILNNIHASLLTKINALELLIHNIGASA